MITGFDDRFFPNFDALRNVPYMNLVLVLIALNADYFARRFVPTADGIGGWTAVDGDLYCLLNPLPGYSQLIYDPRIHIHDPLQLNGIVKLPTNPNIIFEYQKRILGFRQLKDCPQLPIVDEITRWKIADFLGPGGHDDLKYLLGETEKWSTWAGENGFLGFEEALDFYPLLTLSQACANAGILFDPA